MKLIAQKLLKPLAIFTAVLMFNVTDAVHKVFSYFNVNDVGVAYAMDTWEAVKITNNKIGSFSSTLRNAESVYTRHDSQKVIKRIVGRDMKAFHYQGNGFTVAVAFIHDENGWRLYYAMPQGDYDPEEAFEIMLTKVREFCDANGIQKFYAKELLGYDNPKTAETFALTHKMWELERIETADNYMIRYFNRTPEGKKNDRKRDAKTVPNKRI